MNRLKLTISLCVIISFIITATSSCIKDHNPQTTNPDPVDTTTIVTDTIGHSIELIGIGNTLINGNKGYVFKVRGDGSDFTLLDSFSNQTGYSVTPWEGLCKAGNGKFYGVTHSGGTGSTGTIFNFDPALNHITKILDLTATATPPPGFTLAADGNVYSLFFDDVNVQATIIKLHPDDDSYSYLPQGSLNVAGANANRMIPGSDGNLYGVTNVSSLSTSNGVGCVFRYSSATNTLTKLYDRVSAFGLNTFGQLCEASNGLFYGVSNDGGASDMGTVFKFSTTANVYNTVFSFDGSKGQDPSNTNLLEGPGSKLYGFTSGGGASGDGAIYDYDLVTDLSSLRYSFGSSFDTSPTGGFIKTGNGIFYGIANDALFRYDPAQGTYKSIKVLGGLMPGFTGPFTLAEK